MGSRADCKARINQAAGQRVERAWQATPSAPHKPLLKWDVLYQRPPWAIGKSLKKHGHALALKDYDRELHTARAMIAGLRRL